MAFFKTTIKTDPDGGTVYFLPVMDFIVLKNFAKDPDEPTSWRDRWRQAAGAEENFIGKYYFRVKWDDAKVHRSAEITIDSEGKTLSFKPDKD